MSALFYGSGSNHFKIEPVPKIRFLCSYIIKIVFQLCSAQCTVMRFDHFCPMQLYGSCDFQLWIDFESNFIFPSHLGREMKTAFDIFLPFQHDWYRSVNFRSNFCYHLDQNMNEIIFQILPYNLKWVSRDIIFSYLRHFRSFWQKSKHNIVRFLVQMRTRKFASEIYWPLR